MKLFNKSRTYYLWFFSYLIVFLVPLSFSFINYLYSVDIIRNESLIFKKTVQNQMKELIDLRLTELGKMADQVIWDRQIRLYLKLNEPDAEFRKSIEDKIKEIRFLNQSIDQIYIINEDKEFSSGERIIPYNFQASKIDWEKISESSGKSFSYDDINSSSPGNELYLITRFFMIGEGKEKLYAVIFINPDLLYKSLEQLEWLENGAGYVLQSDGSVISSIENIDIDDSFKQGASRFISEHAGTGYAEIKKDRYIVSVIKSGLIDWFYTIVLPEEVLYGKLQKFQTAVFISLLVCLAAGVLLSRFFTRKNFSPLLGLIKLFSGTSFEKIYENYLSEFELLESEIKSVISENMSIRDTIRQNREGLKRVFLRRLVMGEIIEDEAVSDLGSSIGIDFLHDNFAVALINPSAESENDFFSLKKKMDELSFDLEKVYFSYYLVYSGHNVVIVNTEKKDDYSFLSERLVSLTEFIKEKTETDIIVTSGDIHDSFAGISLSYSEALQVLEYRTLLRENNVLLFNELKDLKKVRKFQYLSYLEDEYKIYNLMTAGKYDEAERMLNANIDSVEEHYLNADLIKLRLSGFKNILIEALNTVLKNDSENLKILVKTVLEARNFRQLTASSKNVFIKLSELCPDKSRSSIVSEAKKYIESNYSDKNISVTEISDKLGITSQHLSKIFKEISGTGVLQYINSCRIEEAKKILVNETDISIRDTAGIVGYYNEITFIRNFKNITGISPGKFREASNK